MFYFVKGFDIANYADDSTSYSADKSIEFVVNNLEHSSSILFKRLNDNYMKVNTGKSHLPDSGNVRATAKIDNNYTESEKEEVSLGIRSILIFLLKTILIIFVTASQKLNALARAASYINIQERRIIMKAFILFI